MNIRKQLPNRREGDIIRFEHGGHRFYGGAGRHADGRIGDVFLHSGKTGTQLSITMQDSAIAASLAIQYGCPIGSLRKALLRNDDETPAGPLGQLFDLIDEPDATAPMPPPPADHDNFRCAGPNPDWLFWLAAASIAVAAIFVICFGRANP